jgi:hypothetical protein
MAELEMILTGAFVSRPSAVITTRASGMGIMDQGRTYTPRRMGKPKSITTALAVGLWMK